MIEGINKHLFLGLEAMPSIYVIGGACRNLGTARVGGWAFVGPLRRAARVC